MGDNSQFLKLTNSTPRTTIEFHDYKYSFDYSDQIILDDKTLYRIIAVKNFGKVRKGEKGGYIESEYNLDTNDNSWIDKDSKVCGKCRVTDDSYLYNSILIGKILIRYSTIKDSNLFGDDRTIYEQKIKNENNFNLIFDDKPKDEFIIYNIGRHGSKNKTETIFYIKNDILYIKDSFMKMNTYEWEFVTQLRKLYGNKKKVIAEYLFAIELAKFHFNIREERNKR
jgi:hypothetical protein